MKVVCISCFNYFDTRMHNIIEYFQGKNFEIKYFISDFNHFSKEYYKVDYGFSKQIHVLPYQKNISPKRLLSHYMFSRKVLNEVKHEKPDLIYCIIPPNSLVKYLGKYKKKHSECRLVFDIYDTWPESFPNKNGNFLKNNAFKFWAGLRDNYIKFADLLISVSKSGKEQFEKKYNMNTKVLMPTIPVGALPKYSFEVKNKISFCYLGHINNITDIDIGTEILGGIAKYKRVDLHIIGEGQNKDKWIKMLEAVDVNVINHGVVFDDDEKRKIFEECDMGLNIPRREIGSTMSLKSVEYMRYGLPFVNSGLGDNEDIVRLYKIGINVINGDAIKKIVSLSNRDLMEMHNNSINCYYDKFIMQDYEDIFSEVMNNR